MNIELSSEQSAAISGAGEPCIRVVDPATHKTYLLIEEGQEPALEAAHIEYLREGLKLAEQQTADGQVRPWSIQEAIQRGQKLHREREPDQG